MAITLATTMDALASAMLTVSGIERAYASPTEGPKPVCAIVGYPESFEPAATYGRATDHAVFPVWVLCGLQADANTRSVVSAFITGSADCVDALEAVTGGAYIVTAIAVEGWNLNADERPVIHTAIRFTVEVTA